MPCPCCGGCCCDGETGSQTLETPCEAPKVFHGKGTICDVCCDLGEIREDIDSEEDCPGTWVTNGRSLESPCGCSGPCDEATPCVGGCVCVDGECKLCVGCWDGECYWPSDEFDGYYPCTEDVASPCCTDLGERKSRYRAFSFDLPHGVTWKEGYPAALAGCDWMWCIDLSFCPCYNTATIGCSTALKFRYRLLALNCSQERFDDITSRAANGATEGEYLDSPFSASPVAACREVPTYVDFLTGPEPICPP